MFQKPKYIYCFGGWDENGQNVSTVSRLQVATSQYHWESCPPMEEAKHCSAGAIIGSRIYILGGYDGDDTLNSMEVFETETQTWQPLDEMPDERDEFSAAVLEGHMYICGGRTGDGKTDSVMRYTPMTDQWTSVTPMLQPRRGHQLEELAGRLYAISDRERPTMEAYDPRAYEWEFVTSPKHRHYNFGSATHDGKLYVCSEAGFESYCPRIDKWESLPEVKGDDDYHGRSLVAVGEDLWAIGGGKNGDKKAVFCYGVSTGSWKELPDMDVYRMYHCSLLC